MDIVCVVASLIFRCKGSIKDSTTKNIVPSHSEHHCRKKTSLTLAPLEYLQTMLAVAPPPIFQPNYLTNSSTENDICWPRAWNFRIYCEILSEGHWCPLSSCQGSYYWISVITGSTWQSRGIKLKQSRWNSMDGVWDTFKYSPKPLLTSNQINGVQVREIKEVQNVNFGFAWCHNCLSAKTD